MFSDDDKMKRTLVSLPKNKRVKKKKLATIMLFFVRFLLSEWDSCNWRKLNIYVFNFWLLNESSTFKDFKIAVCLQQLHIKTKNKCSFTKKKIFILCWSNENVQLNVKQQWMVVLVMSTFGPIKWIESTNI